MSHASMKSAPKTLKNIPLRLNAARIIGRVLKGESLGTALPAAEARCDNKDISLLRQLCYTTFRHWFSLNAALDTLLSKPLKPKEVEVKALMLLGLCQLFHTRIPAHAAISETVGAVKGLKKPWANGLVNAILRNAQRQEDELKAVMAKAEIHSELPDWLYGKLAKRYPEQLEAIIAGSNSHAPMTLRVNSARGTRDEYLQKLIGVDIAAQACIYSDHGIQLSEPVAVDKLPGFFDGLVSVQDEAAQLSAAMLECQPGDKVLDACAAPGGKTCHLLENTEDLELTALDLEADRLTRVEENLERLQLQAGIIQGDASKPESWWDGQPYDRILLDAPCSATGVIRRHPDIKLLRRADDIAQLKDLQSDILDAMWRMLKPGGTLVYATCSILPEENNQQIERFLARCPQAMQDTPIHGCGLDTGFGLQLLPQPDSHDGFFYCRLRKPVNVS